MSEKSFVSILLTHKTILIALGAVVVIAIVSGTYYFVETRTPAAVSLPAAQNEMTASITAPGTVEPLENPDLSFAASGRVSYVGVKVGDRVYSGETLASLDIAALSAQKVQAQADEKAAQAKLDQLQNPPRATDVAIKQAAVDQATQARVATYATLPSGLSDAYAKAVDAVKTQTDSVFSNPNSTNPSLVFSTTDSNAANAAISARVTAGAELLKWQNELAALPATPASSDLDAALDAAVLHLSVIRSFEDSVVGVLDTAIPTSSYSASSIASAQASVSAARSAVNGLITSLTATKQSIVSEGLAIASAKANLDALNAGASAQDIAAQQAAVERAQAAVAAVQAQIGNNLVTAPFSGTVGSVAVKAGELASPNAPVITLVPDSALQVSVYLTELEVPRVQVGDSASVTLDAYGSGRIFPAHVSEVDAAPTEVNGIPVYQVKLAFDAPDAAVKTGMTANATITPTAQ